MGPDTAPWRVIDSGGEEPKAATAPPPAAGVPWVGIGALLGSVAIAVAAFVVATSDGGVAPLAIDGGTPVGSDGLGGPAASAAPDGSGGTILVEVAGAVARPGLYPLPTGARVGDAIEAAGGYGPRVDLARADVALNLAATLSDGTEVRVPSRDDPPATAPAAGGSPTTGGSGPIDLNTATAEQLDTLPGVGPATAAKIIAAREERPFASVDELDTRDVLGPATLAKVRDLVTVGP